MVLDRGIQLVPQPRHRRALREGDNGEDEVYDEKQNDEGPEEDSVGLFAVDHAQDKQRDGDLAETGAHCREGSRDPNPFNSL